MHDAHGGGCGWEDRVPAPLTADVDDVHAALHTADERRAVGADVGVSPAGEVDRRLAARAADAPVALDRARREAVGAGGGEAVPADAAADVELTERAGVRYPLRVAGREALRLHKLQRRVPRPAAVLGLQHNGAAGLHDQA